MWRHPAAAARSRRLRPLGAAFAGGTWLGSVINSALVARRVEGGSSSREPTPRCGTTRGSATGWCACRVARCAIARSCRLRSGGSMPRGLRCTELQATSSTPTTRSRTAAKTMAEKSGETVGLKGPRGVPRAIQDLKRAGDCRSCWPKTTLFEQWPPVGISESRVGSGSLARTSSDARQPPRRAPSTSRRGNRQTGCSRRRRSRRFSRRARGGPRAEEASDDARRWPAPPSSRSSASPPAGAQCVRDQSYEDGSRPCRWRPTRTSPQPPAAATGAVGWRRDGSLAVGLGVALTVDAAGCRRRSRGPRRHTGP